MTSPNFAHRPLAVSAAVLLLAVVAWPGQLGAASPSAATCPATNTISAAHFLLPAGARQVLTQDTTIRAPQVSILGTLTTSDAMVGSDAPSLCIETERLTIGPAGILCTGNGADGADMETAFQNATGTDGSNGGNLALVFRDEPSTLFLPALTKAPGGLICTGRGGNGGDAVTGNVCRVPEASSFCAAKVMASGLTTPTLNRLEVDFCEKVVAAAHLPMDLFANVCSLSLPSCDEVADKAGVFRQDPCHVETPCPSGVASCAPTCEELADRMGVFREDPCGLRPCPSGVASCVPSCGEVAGTTGPLREDPCSVPCQHGVYACVPTCQELMQGFLTVGLLDVCNPVVCEDLSDLCGAPDCEDILEDTPSSSLDADPCDPMPRCYPSWMEESADNPPWCPCPEPGSGNTPCLDPVCLDTHNAMGNDPDFRQCAEDRCEAVLSGDAAFACDGNPDDLLPACLGLLNVSALGGSGGSGGTLALSYGAPLALAPAIFNLGSGGSGGDAVAIGRAEGGHHATGGDGGESRALVNGQALSLPTHASVVQSLATSGGGSGGSALALPDVCDIDPGPCAPLIGPNVVYCLLAFVPSGCDTDGPANDVVVLVGCPGDDATVEGGTYVGPAGNGNAGADGASGKPSFDPGVSAWPVAVSGSVGCTSNTPAQDGQSASVMTAPHNGDPSDAKGGNGRYGSLLGGKGGNAYVHASRGGHGASAGDGGMGDHESGAFGCHDLVLPGNGGDAQKGGASGGASLIKGGDGGQSAVQGGMGGDAGGQYGTPGNGGNGGSAGYVSWHHSGATSCYMTDHGYYGDYCDSSAGPIVVYYRVDGTRGCRGLRGDIAPLDDPEAGAGGTIAPPNPAGQPGPAGSASAPKAAAPAGTDGVNGARGKPKSCA